MSRNFTVFHLPGAVTMIIGSQRQAAIDFSGSRIARDVLSDRAAGPTLEEFLQDRSMPPVVPWEHFAARLRGAGVPVERLEQSYAAP